MADQQTTASLSVGDWIADNDPRMPNRVLEVNHVDHAKARAAVPGRGKTGETWISLGRIHLDEKPRRSGWSRVAKP